MRNFVFHNPTKIIFGKNTIPGIGAETAALARKVLLVYGSGSIKANGIHRAVTASLAAAGVVWVEHGGVRSNPVLSHVHEGISLAVREKVDAVLAVGGGSVIDAAKAICAGAPADCDVWQFLRGKKGIRAALPLLCVLTLAASGSEMNGGMVITNEATRQKFGTHSGLLYPRVSILDPEATYSVPPDYSAWGAVDAISHVLEFYFTARESDVEVQNRLMEGLIAAIMAACDRVLADPRDYQGRAELMWGATLALNGLTGAGLGMVGFPMHMIEHSLSALYDVPHGAGLAVVVPGWLRWHAQQEPAKVARLGRMVFGLDEGALPVTATATIDHLRRWFAAGGCPTSLSQLGIGAADIPAIADNALGLARVWRLKEYSKERIVEILQHCQ